MIIMTKNKVLPWLLTHYTVQAGYFIGYWRESIYKNDNSFGRDALS
jgi:hypothetical protein